MTLVATPNVRFGMFPAGNDPRLPTGMWTVEQSQSGDVSGGVHEFQIDLIPFTSPNELQMMFGVTALSVQKIDATAPGVVVQTTGMTTNPFDTSQALSQSRVIQTVADADGRSKGQLQDENQMGFDRPWILGYRVDGSVGGLVIRFTNTNGINDQVALAGLFWMQDAAHLPMGPQVHGSDLVHAQEPNYGTGQSAYYSKLRRGEEPVAPPVSQIPPGQIVRPRGHAEQERLAAISAADRQRKALADFGQAPVGASDLAIARRIAGVQAETGISTKAASSLALGLSPIQVILQNTPAGTSLNRAPGAAYANLTGRFNEND